jgi:formylglycine-generating enzyme required for sulfatase activity
MRLNIVAVLGLSLVACEAEDSEAVDESVSCSEAQAAAPPQMVCIEGGAFVNGSDPRLQRQVQTYWLDTTDVTVAQYTACVGAGAPGCTTPGLGGAEQLCNGGVNGRENHPINCVDWFQASAYCAWAGKRLPDEWEWEWAARGRDAAQTYPWGAEAPTCTRAVMLDPDFAEGIGCGAYSTAAVGSKPAGASRDGVQDLAGNVSEWTDSWYAGAQTGRVLRGGTWYASDDRDLRADSRVPNGPSERSESYGFRCARTP